ncbi:MAG: DUF5131 family protein [Syntrophaceae bacterium]
MQKTGIEYLDYTWNPMAMRCTPCSPGCEHCWHLRMADRLKDNPKLDMDERFAFAGDGYPFLLRMKELEAPLRLKKPAVIGVQFMGDLFHEDVPFEFQLKAYWAMAKEVRHTFIILTKRPKIMAEFIEQWETRARTYDDDCDLSLPNVWHGLTVCNQPELDAKIEDFLRVQGKKFISYEPALGAVDFSPYLPTKDMCARCGWIPLEGMQRYLSIHGAGAQCVRCKDILPNASIDLIIAGGETGPGARPLHPEWVRSVRDQCAAAGVPFFFKQWGEWIPISQQGNGDDPGCSDYPGYAKAERCVLQLNGEVIDAWPKGAMLMRRVGHKAAGRLLDGREWNELLWKEA